MVFFAAAVAVLGVVLKLMAAERAGWFLLPLAAAAGIYHIIIHARAARIAEPPIALAAVSDVLLFGAILLQIDFSWKYHCGHTTYDELAWTLGWTSERVCTVVRGFPAMVLDLAYYIPVASTWRLLRRRYASTAGPPAETAPV